MPGFEEKLEPANPFANVPTPWREDAAPVAHPYRDWKPTGRGDARALTPYVDDDLNEHRNPVAPWLTGGDAAHLVADAMINGAEPSRHAGSAAAKLFGGEASTGQQAFQGVNCLASALSIAGGIMDISEGADQWKHGDKASGAITGLAGAASIGSGGAGLATLGGLAGAGPWAPALGSFSGGLKVGHYGDNQVEKLGWLHDNGGKALSASEWAANVGVGVDSWVSKHASPTVGTAAGLLATYEALGPAAVMAVGGAAVSTGHAIGGGLAHHHRTNTYANYGVSIDGGAGSLADYDDDREAAIARSKAQHPERWGHNPNNATYGQAFSQMFGQVNATIGGTHK